jgi:hypothetical protein
MDAYLIQTFTDLTARVVDRTRAIKPDDPTSQMMGLLFMREGQPLVDKEIKPSLHYFHRRSADAIDFIIPGWKRNQQYVMGRKPSEFATFDVENFVKSCDVVSDATTWKYSGGIDLLLFTTRETEVDRFEIDFGGVIGIDVLSLRERKLVESADVRFERIFSFAKNYKGSNPLTAFAVQETRVSALHSLLQIVLGYLPKEVKDPLQYASTFGIKDFTRRDYGSSGLLEIKRSRSGNPMHV